MPVPHTLLAQERGFPVSFLDDNFSYLSGLIGSFSNRNLFINPRFYFAQRNTSLIAGTGDRYCLDRWLGSSAGTTIAPSQQAFALGQTDVPGEPEFFCRNVVASVVGAANYATHEQRIEDVRSGAGRTITWQLWAKSDAVRNVCIEMRQCFGTGGAPSADVTGIGISTFALATTWQQYVGTVTLPSISGKTLGSNGNDYVAFTVWLDAGSNFAGRTNALGQQSGTFDFAEMQIEYGGASSAFEIRSFGTEQALCDRYYRKSYALGVVPGTVTSVGAINALSGANGALLQVQLGTRMRAIPAITIYNPNSGATGSFRDNGGVDRAATVGQIGDVGFLMSSNAGTAGIGQSGHYVAEIEL